MEQPVRLRIKGMHCASCEVLIERRLRKVEGVEGVKVNHSTGEAELTCSRQPSLKQLRRAVRKAGYGVSPLERREPERKNTKRDYFEIGGLFLILIAAYFLLKQFSLVPEIGITDGMGYGLIFVIGLIAATSTCLAVSGGLLLALATKYREAHPNLSGAKQFKPHAYFNIGRIISYTVLGGALGAAGSLFVLSESMSGALTIAVSMVMVVLGLQMLHLFPKRWQFRMPKFLAHRIYDETGKEYRAGAPLAIGAATFFLPCGFTQALQLYVLTAGSWMTGALTMLVFSLGTAPALIGVGAISSFSKGAFHKHFLRFAAVLVILLGVFSMGAGANLLQAGSVGITTASPTALLAADPNVQVVDGRQIVNMRIVGYDYYPHQFRVVAGMPVEWRVDATQAAGCGRVLVAPGAGVREYIQTGSATFTFTPTRTGTIPFTCSMGMMTPGARFEVVETVQPACDPTVTTCATEGL